MWQTGCCVNNDQPNLTDWCDRGQPGLPPPCLLDILTDVMKAEIHPEYIKTKVHCNGCGTSFETRSTVAEITVEICSNCHPFYTGKQKLVDTAGRVDKFNARRAKAQQLKKPVAKAADPEISEIQSEFAAETVELPSDTKNSQS